MCRQVLQERARLSAASETRKWCAHQLWVLLCEDCGRARPHACSSLTSQPARPLLICRGAGISPRLLIASSWLTLMERYAAASWRLRYRGCTVTVGEACVLCIGFLAQVHERKKNRPPISGAALWFGGVMRLRGVGWVSPNPCYASFSAHRLLRRKWR